MNNLIDINKFDLSFENNIFSCKSAMHTRQDGNLVPWTESNTLSFFTIKKADIRRCYFVGDILGIETYDNQGYGIICVDMTDLEKEFVVKSVLTII